MSAQAGEDLAAQVRALLAGLGDGETTRVQRYQLWTAVLGLLHAEGFAGLGGPPRPQRRRGRRARLRQAHAYEQLAEPGLTRLSAGERIHWLYISVQDVTDIEWLSLLAEIVEDPAAQAPA
ncbi:hypothetical protein [Dactylosporangium sp. NPDC048998]|uniref:hypothetical protein n=1 Tax=Dactylosporangium sp. NPDC048998 TaxID=3363976 RepID=UPI00370FBF08